MLEQSLRYKLLLILTRPIVRYCLRHSHALQDLLAVLKVNFVELAARDTALMSGRSNISRISVLTGVHRTDVAKILKEGVTPGLDRSSIIQRVIGQWRHDTQFSSRPNKPRVLSCTGPNNQFQELVASVTTTIHPAAVLRELQRLEYVEVTPRGVRLRLQFESLAGDPEQGFQLLGKDINTLIMAAEQNVLERPESSNLHVRTEYDNVVVRHLPAIRAWVREEGKAFHKRVREYVSRFDKDLTDGLENEQGGGVVAVGAFAFLEERSEESAAETKASA